MTLLTVGNEMAFSPHGAEDVSVSDILAKAFQELGDQLSLSS